MVQVHADIICFFFFCFSVIQVPPLNLLKKKRALNSGRFRNNSLPHISTCCLRGFIIRDYRSGSSSMFVVEARVSRLWPGLYVNVRGTRRMVLCVLEKCECVWTAMGVFSSSWAKKKRTEIWAHPEVYFGSPTWPSFLCHTDVRQPKILSLWPKKGIKVNFNS